jgi:hypothetical protein
LIRSENLKLYALDSAPFVPSDQGKFPVLDIRNMD